MLRLRANRRALTISLAETRRHADFEIAATDWGDSLETDRNFICVELIDDPAGIAECWARAGHAGDRMICRRCGDADLTIAAILVVPAGGESRWALCAACLLEMP